jgi:hypothetical protein
MSAAAALIATEVEQFPRSEIDGSESIETDPVPDALSLETRALSRWSCINLDCSWLSPFALMAILNLHPVAWQNIFALPMTLIV